MKLSRRPFLIIGLVAVVCVSSGSCREEEKSTATDSKTKNPKEHIMDSATPLGIKPRDRGYKPLSKKELKEKLTPLQYKVTQEEGTERGGTDPRHNSKDPGIYVDIISGEPLFSSTEKFDSGTGWPSFWAPIHKEEIVEKEDRKFFQTRVEVRSKTADSHLGHVFPDGPRPTGLRYCINGSALRFIPKADLEKEGYGEYLKLFGEKPGGEGGVAPLPDVSQAALTLLRRWLEGRLPAEVRQWVADRSEALAEDRDAYLAFALASRKVGKEDMKPAAEEAREAEACCPGWTPARWTLDQVARTMFLLAGPEDAFERRLDQLCATGDVGEQITLYQALPLYPRPERLRARAAEGLRTNIIPVFEAVAHHNPYPKTHFDEAAWNQMVLKALFIGSSLDPIQGLDARANEVLARTLIDYARERGAAGRSVSSELWRCVGPFLTESRLADLRRAWDSGEPMEREAVALALATSDLPAARAWLASEPEWVKAVDSGAVSWRLIHQRVIGGC